MNRSSSTPQPPGRPRPGRSPSVRPLSGQALSGRLLSASSWTSAGDAVPRPDAPAPSPHPVTQRIDALAASGWSGIGLTTFDLAAVREDIGFAEAATRCDAAGLHHREVEFAYGWWAVPGTGEAAAWEQDRTLLLQAAEGLGASFIKGGLPFGPATEDLERFAEPLAALADDASGIGVDIVLEPIAFAQADTPAKAFTLAELTGRDNVGVCIDYWHLLRTGTSAEDLRAQLVPERLRAVEISDARAAHGEELFRDQADRRVLPGEGDADVLGYTRVLAEAGFTGPWGVEMLSDEYRRLPLEMALRAAYRAGAAVLAQAEPLRAEYEGGLREQRWHV